MTAKQKRFCDEYLIDTNGAQAAIRAGYSPKAAKEQAARLLTNANIKSYIEERMAAIQDKNVADAEETMRYLTSVLRGEATDEILRLNGEGIQVKDEVSAATKDRLKAAELLGKRYGLFSDKVNISGSVPVMFADDLGE